MPPTKTSARLFAIGLALVQFVLAVAPCTAQVALQPSLLTSGENAQPQVHAPTVTILLWVDSPTMMVDGVRQAIDPGRDTKPIIRNGRTLVPARAIIEELGGVVSWQEEDRKVSIARADIAIDLWIGEGTTSVNGVSTPVDPTNPQVVPEIVNGRTMLPLRFVAENLGATVTWNQRTREIGIVFEQHLMRNSNRSITLTVGKNETATCRVYVYNPLTTSIVVKATLQAPQLPRGWMAEFCCGDACCFKSMDIALTAREQKCIELSVQARGGGEGNVSLFVGSEGLESEGINVHVISKGAGDG